MRPRSKRILGVVGALILVGVLILRYLLFTASAPPDLVSQMTSPQKQAVVGQVEEKVRELTTPQPGAIVPRQVRLTQQEANVMIRNYIESAPTIARKLTAAGVSDVMVGFGQGSVTAVAKIQRGGIRVPISVSADIVGSGNGQIVLSLRDIKLGRMDAPGDLRQKLAGKLGLDPNHAVINLPKGISSVQVSNGELVLQSNGEYP